MSRHSRKRADGSRAPPPIADDTPMWIAIAMFIIIIITAFAGKLFRHKGTDGQHPFPYMMYGLMAFGPLGLVYLVLRKYYSSRPAPAYLRKYFPREEPV